MYKKETWGEICQCYGYKTLNKALNGTLKEVGDRVAKYGSYFRTKEEYLTKFRWIMGRAQHYAHHQDRPVSEVLDEWESKRLSVGYNWNNYYQEFTYPKLTPKKSKPMKHITWVRQEIKRGWYKEDSNKHVTKANQRDARTVRTKKARYRRDL